MAKCLSNLKARGHGCPDSKILSKFGYGKLIYVQLWVCSARAAMMA